MAHPMGSNEVQPLFSKIEDQPLAARLNAKFRGRSLTLISITFLLNVLLWSSIVSLAVAIYQIASDPFDVTSISSEVLTLTSACVSIFYSFFHTIIFFKQRIWLHQRRDQSSIERTSHVAVRIVVSLCVLWLLTSGWNMILVARRPSCSPDQVNLQPWEIGIRCDIIRLGMAFAMLALIASIILFIMLATVSRPFEAHLFKCSLQQPISSSPSPSTSSRYTPPRRASLTSAKYAHTNRRSFSTQRSLRSRLSDAEIETLDLNSSRPPSIYAPSPQRSLSLGIFTTGMVPPAISSAYATPPRASSLELPPPIFHPSISHQPLTRPPRLSGSDFPSLFRPESIAPQYAASTWRAVHPEPQTLRRVSRSNPHLSGTASAYCVRYSRSSLAVTKPQRLASGSKSESMTGSSRSDSTGPEGRQSQASSQRDDEKRRSVSAETYHAMTTDGSSRRHSTDQAIHKRISSPSDFTAGADDLRSPRMAKGWKPQPKLQDNRSSPLSPTTLPLTTSRNIDKGVRSASGTFLSRFRPNSSPTDHSEQSVEGSTRVTKELPSQPSHSVEPVNAYSMRGSTAIPASVAEAAAAMISRMPSDLKSPTRVLHSEGKRRVDYEHVKNKPLPKIARL